MDERAVLCSDLYPVSQPGKWAEEAEEDMGRSQAGAGDDRRALAEAEISWGSPVERMYRLVALCGGIVAEWRCEIILTEVTYGLESACSAMRVMKTWGVEDTKDEQPRGNVIIRCVLQSHYPARILALPPALTAKYRPQHHVRLRR